MNLHILGIITTMILISCGSKVNNETVLETNIDTSELTNEPTYFNLKPPTTIPEIFNPAIISKPTASKFGSVFNKEGTAFYYGINIEGRSAIWYTEIINNQWSDPQELLPGEKFGYNDPFLSPDERRLFFISKRSPDGLTEKNDHDIWYVEKNDAGWSGPINAGPSINTDSYEYYISFTKDGTMYFSSNGDICFSKLIDGQFQKAVVLGGAINTSNKESDVFIDPNESYMIFSSVRPGNIGWKGDLFISFRNADKGWTKAVNMGEDINSEGHEMCPFVSYDGKYLFYSSRGKTYWVDARVIEQFKD